MKSVDHPQYLARLALERRFALQKLVDREVVRGVMDAGMQERMEPPSPQE
jgi:hypothetical protein